MNNFGNGYNYVEDNQEHLAEGEYEARIKKVSDNANFQNAINVFFDIKGHPNATPYSMTLFARPQLGEQKKNGTTVEEKDLKQWDFNMSRFFDAFNIPQGNFNFQSWTGHSGWVICKKNKNNEYSSLYVAFNQHKEPATKQEKTKDVPTVVKAVADAVGGEIFNEDIPF